MDPPEDWFLSTPEKDTGGIGDWIFYSPPKSEGANAGGSSGTNSAKVALHTNTLHAATHTKNTDKVNDFTTDNAKERRGRKRLSTMFPGIVQCAENFVQQNSFSADPKRRVATGRSCGVTVSQVKEHVETAYKEQGLSNVSRHTVRRWMAPPNKNFNTSKLYTSEIDAKIPSKANTVRKEDDNQHYYAARVKYALEYSSKFHDSTTVYSCDCMNKVKIGTMAIEDTYCCI